MIQKTWQQFDAAESRSSEKRNIAKSVVDHVRSRDPPGRFVKHIRAGPFNQSFEVWLDIGDKRATDRASRALSGAKNNKCNAIEANSTDQANHQSPRPQPHPPAQQQAGETALARARLQPHPTTQQRGRETAQARVLPAPNLGEVNYYSLQDLPRHTAFFPYDTIPYSATLLGLDAPYGEMYILLHNLAPTILLVSNTELRQFFIKVLQDLAIRPPVPLDQSRTLPYQPLLGQAIGGSNAALSFLRSNPHLSVALRIQTSGIQIGRLTNIPEYVVGQLFGGQNTAHSHQNFGQPPSVASMPTDTRSNHNRTSPPVFGQLFGRQNTAHGHRNFGQPPSVASMPTDTRSNHNRTSPPVFGQVAGQQNTANSHQNFGQPPQQQPSNTTMAHNRTWQPVEADHHHHGSAAATGGTSTSTTSEAAQGTTRITPDQSSDDAAPANKKRRL